ncbi:MAG TPA: C13 family peptidase [Longimicrobiales bacterium]
MRAAFARMAAAWLLLLGSSVPAVAQGAGGAHLVILSGLSGEERFARDFTAWGAELVSAAETRHGVPAANIVWLAEDAEAHDRIRDRSTKANIEGALRSLAARTGADDRVLVVIYGHGSHQAGESRVNLPGPDITAKELAALLGGLRARQVAVVNTTSASGGFIQDLAAPGRIVVTATKSGMEANETVFGRYFTAALTGDAADTDKDGRTSLLEAFDYARAEVAREYQRGNKLLTEHAMLDGVGDGKGAAEPAAASPHARAAGAFHLAAVAAAAVNAAPELRALYEEKARLESAIAALRARRDSMDAAAYERELERLLLELSRNGQAIRRLEGGAP